MSLLQVRDAIEVKNFLGRMQIISGSFALYEGAAGFEDFGVNGFPIKKSVIEAWRYIMVDSDIFEVETPQITPYEVLKASGHADRFFDYVIYDEDKKCHRADHLVKQHVTDMGVLVNVDDMGAEALEAYIKRHKLVPLADDAKITTKSLSLKVEEDFLRPELAQGIFVNMKQYLDYFARELPFGIAQTGKSFRREVNPQPFIRLREFSQAEIEFFFCPSETNHKLYDSVKSVTIPILTAKNQEMGCDVTCIEIGVGVDSGIICNEIMGYFLGKIFELALYIGLDPDAIRFRQHLPNEMAHYAIQCWDLECLVFGSWLECVGCAHRGAHDLTAHNIKDAFLMKGTYTTKIEKSFNVKEMNRVGLNHVEIFKAEKELKKSVEELVEEFQIPESCVRLKEVKIWNTYIPNVIEPSVGIDRLCYAMLVHNLFVRAESPSRMVLRLRRCVARYDYAVFPLSNDSELIGIVMEIISALKNKRLKCFTDLSSVNIGKRYIRADELGVAHSITVDFLSLKDGKVTVRDRDSMEQVRIAIGAVKEYT
ncbi:MAG: glycyl-tRNA synthetase [Harvfovirus sp.]|uniref:glycine--tRNA ligase n=1 Tax=Harvfovirus sp. TaxID=2487768 RepID=A0A3G5A6C8_9VIRU|nr:MAG: glycyl-tRNA synthetase [Harvfovirus sp.]